MGNSMYNINLKIDQKYIPMIYDMIRMFTIQFITQLLVSINNPSVKLFNTVFLTTTLFILLGVGFYWVVVKNAVYITSVYTNDFLVLIPNLFPSLVAISLFVYVFIRILSTYSFYIIYIFHER